MRHQKSGLKLNRTGSHRKAMFRNMVTSLLKYGKIKTTDTKAKEVRRWVENIITLAKNGDLHSRRQALSIVKEKRVIRKLFSEAAEKFGSVAGGYTRITKVGRRFGDAAMMSIIELIPSSSRSQVSTKKRVNFPERSKKQDYEQKANKEEGTTSESKEALKTGVIDKEEHGI